MSYEKRIAELGLHLPKVAEPRGSYLPGLLHRGICRTAGQLAFMDDGSVLYPGKLGVEVTVEQGQEAVERATLNALAAVRYVVGSLDLVEQVLRLHGYVNSGPGFGEQHLVTNGGSDLLQAIFGEAGRHSRTSIGVSELPFGASVEVEIAVAIRGEVH